ncbi:MAG: hypothetical protein IJS87_02390 [Rhodocyclaceae bacterium]|nr:hypothetical protein [Rhodocyclaceae bacterium]
MQNNQHPEPWFSQRIQRGLTSLLALRLESAPPADAVAATARVWEFALWPGRVWDEDADAGRIGEAFRQLALTQTHWPAPAAFLRVLPARAPVPALAAPKLTPEEREHNRQRVQAMMDMLRAKFDVTGDAVEYRTQSQNALP